MSSVPEPAGEFLVTVRVVPGARSSAALGAWGGALKLAVAAPPRDGRANAAAAELLAVLFALRPSAVELVRGHSSRSKVFRLRMDPARARARLTELLDAPPR